jgi:hypothetical protein
VLDRLRTLIGKEAKKPAKEIPFDDLPSYIERREKSIRRRLEDEVSARRPPIVTAIESLQDVLNSFSDIERKPSSHPKLEKIAQSSLPHFVRSFQQHINRPLPADADDFYHEAGVLLKGCITTMKGAGKYLPMVFPEEMKVLRNEIGIIGRTINELTTLFSQAREERSQLLSLHNKWNAIRSLVAEKEERKNRIENLRDQVKALHEEREGVRQSLEGLRRSEDYRLLKEYQIECTRREEEGRSMRLQKEQILGAVLSVYRRAARIARHQNNREMEKGIEQGIDLLEAVPLDYERIDSAIDVTVAPLLRLIQTGALSLKGQDEQRIFSTHESLRTEVFRACREIRSAEEAVQIIKRKIQEMPVHANLLHLKSEEGRIIHTYEKTLEEQSEEEGAVSGLPERIRTLQEDLEKQVSIIFEGECSIILTRMGKPE